MAWRFSHWVAFAAFDGVLDSDHRGCCLKDRRDNFFFGVGVQPSAHHDSQRISSGEEPGLREIKQHLAASSYLSTDFSVKTMRNRSYTIYIVFEIIVSRLFHQVE